MKATITAFGFLLLLTTFSHGGGEPTVSLKPMTLTAETPTRLFNPMAVSLDVVHTVGVSSGGIPKTLTRYGKYLRRAGSEHWKLNAKKRVQMSPGAEKLITLPGKLGKARVSLDAKGVATVKIVDMKGKSLGTYRSSRFPLVIANNRLRIDGQPYVFILDRTTKK